MTAKYFNILKIKSLEWNMSKIINLRIKQFLKRRKYENIELYILEIKKLKEKKEGLENENYILKNEKLLLENENSELKDKNEKLDDEIYEMGTSCLIMDELKRDNSQLKMKLDELNKKLSKKRDES